MEPKTTRSIRQKTITVLSLGVIGLFASSCSQIVPSQFDSAESEFGSAIGKEWEQKGTLGKIEATKGSLIQPKPLAQHRPTYLVLQFDGGGMMGTVPSQLLAKLEDAVLSRNDVGQSRLRDRVSFCSGTSTGAIIAGCIAAGVPATEIAGFYQDEGYELFRKKGKLPLRPILQFQYNRELFQQALLDSIQRAGAESPLVRLGELPAKPSLVLAAYDLVGKKTVFLQNRDEDNSPVNTEEIQLLDAISASAFSAAVYFGKLPAPEVQTRHLLSDGTTYAVQGAIFADGGQGTQNSTMALAGSRSMNLCMKHPEAQVVLISFGCGNNYDERSFAEVEKYRDFQQITDFVFRNQARSEAALLQWKATLRMEKMVKNLKVFRFDWHYDPSVDPASAFSATPEAMEYLNNKAQEISERSDFQQLLQDLRNPAVRIQQAP